MNHPHIEDRSWDRLSWQEIQAIGMALAERHAGEPILALAPERLTRLLAELPGLRRDPRAADDFILSAIITAWISAIEGEDHV